MDLIQEHCSEPAACSHVPKKLLTKPQRQVTSPTRVPEAKCSKRKARCAICPRSKDRKTSHMCHTCGKHLCVEHEIYVCDECVCVPEREVSE
jgi:hypothetical protein